MVFKSNSSKSVISTGSVGNSSGSSERYMITHDDHFAYSISYILFAKISLLSPVFGCIFHEPFVFLFPCW